jgi:histidyl-tRNA synthetase
MSPTRISPVSFLKLSTDVASFYGFSSVRDIEEELRRARKPIPRSDTPFASVAHLCAARAATPQEPVLAFYASPSVSHAPRDVSPRETAEFGLCAVGGDSTSGEIVILKTLSTIVSEWGMPIARVRLNALGDRDSKERYAREMGAWVRRRAGDLEEDCRQAIARNPLAAHHCAHERCQASLADSPRSVNYLSERSRAHFRKVLEQVESLGFAYEIDDHLLGDEREQQVVFALDFATPDATVVGSLGGRYDDYLRRVVGRKDAGAVSASIYFRKKGAGSSTFKLRAPVRTPKVFFVQLGPLAKLQGLSVLDMLRRGRIPVSQSFDASRLSPQLTAASSTGVSHIILMGQREALDGTVIVRSLNNSSQMVVALAQLPRILKQLKI